MKTRFLPIPLILLTPLVLLVIVVAAGIYRFSLSDEEIMAKFPSANTTSDTIARTLFGLSLTNPVTIPVPETPSVAFMETWDEEQHWVMGQYDTGSDRGSVALNTQLLIPLQGREKEYGFVSIIRVSNQGSGIFNYLALFKFDELRSRMVMVDSQFLGDRVMVESLQQQDSANVEVSFLNHTKNMPFNDAPTQFMSILFSISEKYQLVRESLK